MSGINKVILIGNVGNDPDIRYANNGSAIANVSLATSENWKDKTSGERQTRTEWHRVVFFGRIAEVVNEYVRKGSKLYIEGKLQTRKWTDQNNNERYSTEVVVDVSGTMQMLDSRQDRGSYSADNAYANTNSPSNQPPPSANSSTQQAPTPNPTPNVPSSTTDDFNDDDIPF